jgi:hypothetical protein
MLQTTTSTSIMPQKFNWIHSRRSDLKWIICRNGGLDSQCQSRFRPRLDSNSVSVLAVNNYLDNIGFWPLHFKNESTV